MEKSNWKQYPRMNPTFFASVCDLQKGLQLFPFVVI